MHNYCLSSAYWWWWLPNAWVTFASGAMYSVKRRGPSDENASVTITTALNRCIEWCYLQSVKFLIDFLVKQFLSNGVLAADVSGRFSSTSRLLVAIVVLIIQTKRVKRHRPYFRNGAVHRQPTRRVVFQWHVNQQVGWCIGSVKSTIWRELFLVDINSVEIQWNILHLHVSCTLWYCIFKTKCS